MPVEILILTRIHCELKANYFRVIACNQYFHGYSEMWSLFIWLHKYQQLRTFDSALLTTHTVNVTIVLKLK